MQWLDRCCACVSLFSWSEFFVQLVFCLWLVATFSILNLLGIFFWQDGMFCSVCENVLLYRQVMKVKRNAQLGLYSETSSEDEEERTQGNRSSPFTNANQI